MGEPVWISRDKNGAINGIFANRQEGYAEEESTSDAVDVIAHDVMNAKRTEKITVLSQDLLAQFTPEDIGSIQKTINASPAMALLWYSLLAQRDEMQINNERFQTGWSALINVLGLPRMQAIASNLGIIINGE